jgi:hypothetical protein
MNTVNLNYVDQLLVPFCMIPDAEQENIPCDCENDEQCMRSLLARYCVPVFRKWGPDAQAGTKTALRYLCSLEDEQQLRRIVKELFDQPYMVIPCPDYVAAFTQWLWAELFPQTVFEPLDWRGYTIIKESVSLRN